MIQTLAFIGVGGALGAMLRYVVVLASSRVFGVGFPYGTMTVNIVGSIIMGMVVAHTMHEASLSDEMRALIITGFLGGFTTFSAFSLDVVSLFERGDNMAVVGYIMGSIILSVVGLMLGMSVVRP